MVQPHFRNRVDIALISILSVYFFIQVIVQYTQAAIFFQYSDPVMVFLVSALTFVEKIKIQKISESSLVLVILMSVVVVLSLVNPISSMSDGWLRWIYFILYIIYFNRIIKALRSIDRNDLDNIINILLVFGLIIILLRHLAYINYNILYNPNWAGIFILGLVYVKYFNIKRSQWHLEVCILIFLLYLFYNMGTRGVFIITAALLMMRFIPRSISLYALRFVRINFLGVYIFPVALILLSIYYSLLLKELLGTDLFIYNNLLGEYFGRGNLSGRELGLAYFFDEIFRRGNFIQQILVGDPFGIAAVKADDFGLYNNYYNLSYVYNTFLQYIMIYGAVFAVVFHSYLFSKIFDKKEINNSTTKQLDGLIILTGGALIYMANSPYQLALSFFILLPIYIRTIK